MNDREVDRRLKGCKLLFEMLRRSRLRAPSLAEFLKSAVDQVGRIQILHHFRSHDVALGEPEVSFGAPKPATHRRPKPATMWVVLGGRIVLFGPVGKGRDQVVAV